MQPLLWARGSNQTERSYHMYVLYCQVEPHEVIARVLGSLERNTREMGRNRRPLLKRQQVASPGGIHAPFGHALGYRLTSFNPKTKNGNQSRTPLQRSQGFYPLRIGKVLYAPARRCL